MVKLITIFLLGLNVVHGDMVDLAAWEKQSPEDLTDLLAIQERLRELLPDAKKALVSIEAGDGAEVV